MYVVPTRLTTRIIVIIKHTVSFGIWKRKRHGFCNKMCCPITISTWRQGRQGTWLWKLCCRPKASFNASCPEKIPSIRQTRSFFELEVFRKFSVENEETMLNLENKTQQYMSPRVNESVTRMWLGWVGKATCTHCCCLFSSWSLILSLDLWSQHASCTCLFF